MKEFKENLSDFYDHEYFLGMEFRYLSGAHANKIKTLSKFLGDVKGKKILDLGCGGGIFSNLLKDKKADVIGIDYSKSAIEFAKSRYPNINFYQVSAYDLSRFEDNTFDIVLMMDILEHLSDPVLALTEVFRVLRVGGQIMISTDMADSDWLRGGILNKIVTSSMKFSKEGRAFILIKEVESKIKARKHYTSSHINLLSFTKIEEIARSLNLKIIEHEVFPLVGVWWRDLIIKHLPRKMRGDHQMIILEKTNFK